MTIVSADVLSGHLKTASPRDNHVMKDEYAGHRNYNQPMTGC